MVTWPELIRQIKGERTQKEFAVLLGIGQSSVSDLLNGKRTPGGKALRALLAVAPDRREELIALFLQSNIRNLNKK